ncbi:hypothetical protein GJ744_004279 [Endocarpon pusillum]|uniref:C2H2-type domain-containing protein n=1 Tax=Endocarpon pusillum TaxID=364733 RepID=A0A8H7A9J7_9EURO|nr:hypothetical protein GJ744_004279 [Endocarpon pusillum]
MTETLPRRATNEITGEPFPIRAATQACRQKLQECASQASLQEGHWAENRSSDFNLWDSGVGACANELNCLDKRLERDISAQKVVIGALSTLAAWTTKCRELAEAVGPTTGSPDHQPRSSSMSTNEKSTNPSDSVTLDEAKNTVEELLKILVDLEIAIRRAGTASRVRRADRTFNKQKHRYAELSEHLEFILRVSGAPRRNHTSANQRSAPANIDKIVITPASDQSGAPQQSRSSANQRSAPAKTDEIDVKSALDQLQGENAPLRPEQQILLLANIRRTNRFLFYKRRQEQLRSEQPRKPVIPVQVRSSRAQPSEPPITSEEQLRQSLQPLTNQHAAPARSQHSTGTTNQVSDYVPGSSLEKAIKVTSQGVAATTIALRADYPKPPKDKTKCPYCLITFKGEADDVRQWKKHVSEDLQPYTCYLPKCPQHHPFFNTFDAWKAHVLSNDHQQFEGWTCLFCRFCSKPTEESIFLDHIQNKHLNAVAKESLTKFANMCRRFTALALDRCPVCSTYENDWKLRKDSDPRFEPRVRSFHEHLGQCMHYFALRVLPETEPVKPGDGSGQNLTNVSPNEDRSWPSCYLHVSHHTAAGLTETDVEISLKLIHLDQVDNVQRIQTWVELAGNMDDPNSLDEKMRLDPRYDMSKEEKLIEESEDALNSMANRTLTLGNQGRWKGSEKLLVQVIETRKRVLGQEHPDTLTSIVNLASAYRNQGRWKEAEELEVQVIGTMKRVLGQEHPFTLTSVANLASTYRNQGRWKEAEELFVQVIKTRKRVLGKEHPSTLTSIANLASTYKNQGRWKEAEELLVQVIKTRRRVLGQEHPSTLNSIANLASTFGNQGRWKEAEELEIQMMETRKRVLGEEHPSTLTSISNLALTFGNQGRWEEAEELEVQVMKTMKRVLGEEHPSTLTSIANLASTYRNQGRWKEAEELFVQVIEMMKWILGKEHPYTLTSIANLAFTFRDQGRWKEAEELEIQMMETRKRVLGQEHPHTLTSIANLALTFRNQGRWKEAEELEVQVMKIRKRVLGQEHPHTLTSIANLASMFGNQGRWKAAEKLEVQVMETSLMVLGQEHPDTLNSINNLAFIMKEQGRKEEAIKLMAEYVRLQNRVLHTKHTNTLSPATTVAT